MTDFEAYSLSITVSGVTAMLLPLIYIFQRWAKGTPWYGQIIWMLGMVFVVFYDLFISMMLLPTVTEILATW